MREIKFRLFVGGNMEYGIGLREDGTPFKKLPECYYELESDKDFSTNNPVMQYTGLKDKNGKEIYEGDIVECYDHPTGVDNATGDVFFHHGRYWVRNAMPSLDDYGTAWIKVIGNIYENPELLKEEQK